VFTKRRKPDEPANTSPAAPEPHSGEGDGWAGAGRSDPGGAPRPADNGLGVPPYRPATSKEAPQMGRSPFSPTPAPAPMPPQSSMNQQPPRPNTGMPGNMSQRSSAPAERRTLVVGRGISLQGVVQDAERLVVEGTVEATMIHAAELSISAGGVFRGEVEVEDAEVAGTIDGTLTARGNLVVRATGRVLGTARCRRLQVEDGGQITGRIEMITGDLRAPEGRVELSAD